VLLATGGLKQLLTVEHPLSSVPIQEYFGLTDGPG
jgi:hypothetical protein